MESKNYCADCNFHFNSTIEEHAATYHNDGLFRGVIGGNWKEYQKRLKSRKNNFN
ncbi:hypothetical protein SAMN04488133_1955 [Halobellus limi]|uniref:Uncharacterized protein n=1 Tax=Halobellus limi TaxID=699433 RepID=A0A1H5ZFE8_9EURY|nr:hypothetical protein SAMN04488133_1955 [Halobellus limi]